MKRWILTGAVAAALLLAAWPAHGQEESEREASSQEADLGQLYRWARTEALVEDRARQRLVPLPPVPLRTARLDSLRAWLRPDSARETAPAPPEPLPQIRERRTVRRLERPAFENRFSDVRFAYLGTNGRASLDTMRTRELRARLQAHYGDPTRTVVDADSLEGRPAADYVQFEYGFVANGAIPIKVVDTGGPFDRGLVFAAPVRFRNRLQELRAQFFAPLLESRLRASYVDYYFDTGTDTWYRAGFDGRRFFVESVDQREVMPGRRPVLQREP